MVFINYKWYLTIRVVCYLASFCVHCH